MFEIQIDSFYTQVYLWGDTIAAVSHTGTKLHFYNIANKRTIFLGCLKKINFSGKKSKLLTRSLQSQQFLWIV